MPVYLDIFNLIIDKKAVAEKYSGGLEQFREDYSIPASDINQEDDELFSLGQMNSQFDIDCLIKNGLSFKEDIKHSDDFVIIYRYGDLTWNVTWLKHNQVFAWHIGTNSRNVERVNEICNMTMDEITELMEKGDNLFKTISSKDS